VDKHLVCFAGNDWWVHNPMTEKQWMRILARRGWTVLFVNSIGVGMPGLDSPRVFRRVLRKLTSMARFLRRDENVWVLTPVLLPFWSVSVVRTLNQFLLALQLRWSMKRAGMGTALFWAGLPTAASMLRRIPHREVLYYVQDNYTAYYDSMTFSRIAEDHERMLQEADAVICASIGLHERIAATRGQVWYIPHGVHDVFLDAPLRTNESPDDLRDIPHPIIGYWGSLEGLQDLVLIRALAGRHPEWQFVFIGRPMLDLSALAALPHVHFLGPKSQQELPRYAAHFDVAWMSFVQSEWIRYSCPVKLREYLAMGLPVVSPPIIEVERAFPGECATAATVDEFSQCIAEALATDSPEARMRRRALVREQRWSDTATSVETVLRNLRGDQRDGGRN